MHSYFNIFHSIERNATLKYKCILSCSLTFNAIKNYSHLININRKLSWIFVLHSLNIKKKYIIWFKKCSFFRFMQKKRTQCSISLAVSTFYYCMPLMCVIHLTFLEHCTSVSRACAARMPKKPHQKNHLIAWSLWQRIKSDSNAAIKSNLTSIRSINL